MKLLLIDNYDSFTYMLADYIKQCHVECVVKRNDDEHLKEPGFINAFDALVLSPGPKTPETAGLMMQIIQNYYPTKPMLGICLGHQALGQFFGAELIKCTQPKHGKTELITHNNHELFKNIPENFEVTRYHSLILTNLTSPLTGISTTRNNEVMGLAHNQLPLFGIQFHPESCLTTHGITIIKNYTEIVKQHLT